MIENPLLKNILTASITIDDYNPDGRKLVLANLFIFVTAVTLFFFMLYNVIGVSKYQIAMVDAVAFGVAVYAMRDLRKNKVLHHAALIGTANLYIFLIAFTLINKAEDFGIIWTIFFPVFTILVNGRKRGLPITLLFYLTIFIIAYDGIGVWQNGAWNSISFTRFVIASIVLTYIIYFFELSIEKAHEKLEVVRRHEKEQMDKLAKLSITDPLTSLYNRRHLDDVFTRQFNGAKRHRKHLALFLIDLDHFKQYNDLYGHQEGDRVLCQVAKVLKSHMRRSEDYAFRLGGEEFSGIVVEESEDKINTLIESVRVAIEAMGIIHDGNDASSVVTASFGVRMINRFENENFDTMYKAADDALYEAKDYGRNRVVVSQA